MSTTVPMIRAAGRRDPLLLGAQGVALFCDLGGRFNLVALKAFLPAKSDAQELDPAATRTGA
jgi:hypothetical protein